MEISGFSASQILREIKVAKRRNSKIINLTLLEAQDFYSYEFSHFVKSDMDLKSKLRVFKITKMEFLELLGSQKLILHKT